MSTYQSAAKVRAGARRLRAPGEGTERDQGEEAAPRLELEEGSRVRVVEAVGDERVGPEEEAEVVEVGRPLGHEVDPGRDARLVRALERGPGHEERAVGDPGDGDAGHGREKPQGMGRRGAGRRVRSRRK